MTLSEGLRRLPAPLPPILERVAEAAAARRVTAALVGGAVRDLLLGLPTADLDVVVVGEAPALAADVAAGLGAELTVHERFGTATLTVGAAGAGRSIDFVTARREVYPSPGALPEVAPGTLDDDLRRRDFTINALAASLAPRDFGRLVDPLGGRGDLVAGAIRALHPASFRDDPTRLLRAVRYEQRLSALGGDRGPRHLAEFAIEPETLAWLRAAVDDRALATVSVDRVVHEFARLLAEREAAAMVGRLEALGLLRQVHPALGWDRELARAFADLDAGWHRLKAPPPRWFARLALLGARLSPEAARRLAGDLHLPAPAGKLLDEVARLAGEAAGLHVQLAASTLGARLDRYSPAALVVLAALDPDPILRAQVARYLAVLRDARPALTGDYLRSLGVPPGPVYREALAALLAHKRDHPAIGAEDEGRYLRGWLAERGLLPDDASAQ
jgi:tRNA nucleotidyltransferase (CCA-adding enzyme)